MQGGNDVAFNSQQQDDIRSWLHLHMTDQVGPRLFERLLETFGSARAVLDAPVGQLAAVKGIGQKKAEAIAQSRAAIDVDAELKLADKLGVQIITRRCADYPEPLAAIPDPPPVIYIKGTLKRQDKLALAIVGSRHCSPYGQEQASRFAHLLAAAGFTIVSGLARGIDSAAHRGALSTRGRTIAVQGCGLAKVFPPENEELAARIAESGAVISELPLTFEPLSKMFVHRNRIISGLSLGALIVEARHNSGALHTARYALEQSRDVLAVPGRIDAPGSSGPHRLIKDGAQMVEKLEDILDALGPVGSLLQEHAHEKRVESQEQQEASRFESADDPRAGLKLNGEEATIYECLEREPVHVDQIAARTRLKISQINASLTMLQLKGFIKQLPGSFYRRR